LIDDDHTIAFTLARILAPHGITVTHFAEFDEIEALLARAGVDDPWDVIVLDVNMPRFHGVEILHRLRSRNTPTAVVMMTADASAATATAALRAGAFHYIVKPFANEHVVDIVRMAARQTEMSRQTRSRPPDPTFDLEGTLIGRSDALCALRKQIRQLASSTVNVLVTGESGTGKEVVARALHQLSPRRDRGFVPLNCGGIPEGLIDSELFGHTRGSFTGAIAARPGVFVEADGGTLFLDEIGDMPLPVQARLLRAIQQGEIRPVGGDATRRVDVRVIAATNVDLTRAVAEGAFRSDLFFRLNVVNLALPPLRDRRADLPALIAALLHKHSAGGPPPTLSDRALELLLGYDWPGNVRELENALLHAIALTGGGRLEPSALPLRIGGGVPRMASGSGLIDRVDDHDLGPDEDLPLTEAKRKAALDFERMFLVRLMDRTQGSVAAAARLAGIDRTNFRRLLQRHAIEAAQFKGGDGH